MKIDKHKIGGLIQVLTIQKKKSISPTGTLLSARKSNVVGIPVRI